MLHLFLEVWSSKNELSLLLIEAILSGGSLWKNEEQRKKKTELKGGAGEMEF